MKKNAEVHATNKKYRRLRFGEAIRSTDEYLDEDGWVITTCAGGKAPDPQYTAHREYRRVK